MVCLLVWRAIKLSQLLATNGSVSSSRWPRWTTTESGASRKFAAAGMKGFVVRRFLPVRHADSLIRSGLIIRPFYVFDTYLLLLLSSTTSSG